MAIDDKPTAAWREADLQALCDERRRETPRLEFKQELSLEKESAKSEAERDVAGMANAGGGHILFGVMEYEEADGSKVASSLKPLTDGGLYEQLNNVLDSRSDPRIPFELHAITAENGGIYIVVEVFGNRRPHMANDDRYHVRRNLRVRKMTEAEVADAYRQRFERERDALGMPEQRASDTGSEIAGERLRQGLSDVELASFRQETGDENQPGWLSVWSHPSPLVPGLFDPRKWDSATFQTVTQESLWRRDETPFQYFHLVKTLDGFSGRLPPRDDTYPHYLIRIWSDGLLEWGDLQAPAIRRERPEDNRVIPTRAVAEYVHDFLTAAASIYHLAGYADEVLAGARLSHIAGYRLAVEPRRLYRGSLVVREDTVESSGWRGNAADLERGAVEVAHDISDRMFIAGGAENGAYFFDTDGKYTDSQ